VWRDEDALVQYGRDVLLFRSCLTRGVLRLRDDAGQRGRDARQPYRDVLQLALTFCSSPIGIQSSRTGTSYCMSARSRQYVQHVTAKKHQDGKSHLLNGLRKTASESGRAKQKGVLRRIPWPG
jgi:hypothetical protein